MLRELFLVPATLLAGTLLTTPAAASPATGTAVTATGPATAVHYSRAASARQFNGLALDTCAAPSLTTMEAWTGSPYRAIGAYIGGASRTCRQDNLTRDWVTGVTTLGWGVLPIYKGLQPPCGARPADPKIAAATPRPLGPKAGRRRTTPSPGSPPSAWQGAAPSTTTSRTTPQPTPPALPPC